MRMTAASIFGLGLVLPVFAHAQTASPQWGAAPAISDVRSVSPALAQYTEQGLLGEVWKRSGLSPRDRSLVTLAILIGKGQTVELPFHLGLALDNGVKASEISGLVTHLAFYSGWANATAAVPFVKAAFERRGIGADQLPAAAPARMLPLDEPAEAARVKNVGDNFGAISPGLVADTTTFLFKDLWLRPDLAARAHSLVTVSSLIANGQAAQLTSHLRLGMNNGLTKPEIGEVIFHSAFYAGWPNAFSAMTVAKAVFEARPN